MNKMFYFVAVATLGLLSCQQEQDPVSNVVKNEPVTLKASIENFATRATYESGNLFWTSDDKIGIYFSTWTDEDEKDKHKAFTLSSGEGTPEGAFKMDDNYAFEPTNAVAFFPWQGTGSDKNNVYQGTMYFKLPKDNENYTSGQMLTPLIAPLSSSTIGFKHAGAAVKVVVNSLPTYAKSMGLKVDNAQIYGSFYINPNNAGVNAMEVDGDEDITKNEVWLNVKKPISSGAFTFIFPVPEFSNKVLSFSLNDENDVPIWTGKSKSATAQRAHVVAMSSAVTISSPYSQFTATSEGDDWGYIGKFGTHNWDQWYGMKTDDAGNYIAKQTFAEGDLFKIRKGSDWSSAVGYMNVDSKSSAWVTDDGSNDHNIKVKTAGTYYIIFNSKYENIIVVPEPNCTNYNSITFE